MEAEMTAEAVDDEDEPADAAAATGGVTAAGASHDTWRHQLHRWREQLRGAQRDVCAAVSAHAQEERDMMRGSATWSWRSGAFAAMFAPAALDDCNLEGHPPLVCALALQLRRSCRELMRACVSRLPAEASHARCERIVVCVR
jgi:hypothetical protein